MNKEEKNDKTKLKLLTRLMGDLESGYLLVEGLKDKEALLKLGYLGRRIFTISGNLLISLKKLQQLSIEHDDEANLKVFVLTDLDESGDQLANKAKDELEANNFVADIDLRRKLGQLLNLVHFEGANAAFNRFMNELREEKTTKLAKGKMFNLNKNNPNNNETNGKTNKTR